MAAQPSTNRDDWDAAIKAHDDARAVVRALVNLDGDDHADMLDAAFKTEDAALQAVMTLRAPDVAAMAQKAILGVSQAHTDLDGHDTAPDAVERLLSAGGAACAIAALYQDALALSGDTGAGSAVHAVPFDPRAWVSATEAATGAGVTGTPRQWGLAFIGDGEQASAAKRALDGLSEWQREAVVRSLNL